jgi:diguanylate cyclase (GGDEF)-like protein
MTGFGVADLERLTICPVTRLHVRAAGEILHDRHPGRHAAVLMIDLDGLKQVNDRCGHAAGDALLRLAAEIVQANVRHDDVIVTRWGGDEIVVTLWDLSLADTVLWRLRDALDGRYGARASVGLGRGPISDALRQADAAMYEAKAARR